jgi:hypothetical protein
LTGRFITAIALLVPITLEVLVGLDVRGAASRLALVNATGELRWLRVLGRTVPTDDVLRAIEIYPHARLNRKIGRVVAWASLSFLIVVEILAVRGL